MKWNKGFSSRYTAHIVDPVTWKDVESFQIVSGSITHTDSDLLQSAELSMLVPITEQYIRIYLEAKQDNGQSERVALFSGLASVPKISIEGERKSYSLELYSVLKAADDVLLQRGWYAPIGADARTAKQLLSVIPAPIEIVGDSPALTSAIVAEDGETRLTMAKKILDALNWKLKISGDGTVRIIPNESVIVSRFSATANDVLELSVTDSRDWFACPNVFRAISGDSVAIARDDSIDSDLSTVNRGREIWKEETSVTLSDNESLADYAIRRLKEEQTLTRAVGYTRRFDPSIDVGDLVEINYKTISGTFKVTSQKLELSHGCKVTEEASQ